MIEFNRILCPIDFSDTSSKALVYATAFARWYSAHLEVLHIVPFFEDTCVPAAAAVAASAGASAPSLSPGSREELALQMNRTVAATGASDVNHRVLVQDGRIHEVIVNRARAQRADLVVLGTHGRSGFNRLFLGSVAEKVVRSLTCPVLTVPPAAPASLTTPVAFRQILCAIDYSPSSREALRYALDLARHANGRVSVLHVLEYMDPVQPSQPVGAAMRTCRQHLIDLARERLRSTLAAESRSCCEIEEVVALNAHRAYREILQRATAMAADLIVIGAQGAGGLELMLYGSNTHYVVRAASCPVLTLRAA